MDSFSHSYGKPYIISKTWWQLVTVLNTQRDIQTTPVLSTWLIFSWFKGKRQFQVFNISRINPNTNLLKFPCLVCVLEIRIISLNECLFYHLSLIFLILIVRLIVSLCCHGLSYRKTWKITVDLTILEMTKSLRGEYYDSRKVHECWNALSSELE